MTSENKGTLYGVGVGPGDPKLLTLRALEVLKEATVVFAAGSSKNQYSLALNVVRDHLPPDCRIIKLDFPMTEEEGDLLRAWQDNARQVLEVLDQGQDAVFLTIGDPLTYSTFGYLLRTVRQMAPETKVETVPGITAYHAAAARLNLPLVESKESLLVVSGVSDPDDIHRLAACGDNVIIMKAYRNLDRILDVLEELPEKRPALAVSQCCLEGESIFQDAYALRGQKMHYLSLLIVKGAQGD